MISELQRMMNYFPYNADARKNPFSNFGSIFSVVADLDRQWNADFKRLDADTSLLTAYTDYWPVLYSWDLSTFSFVYNGRYVRLPTFTGDTVELTEITVSELNGLMPTNITETATDEFVNLITILDETTLSDENLDLDIYPCKLYLVNQINGPIKKLGNDGSTKSASLYIKGYDKSFNQIEENFPLAVRGTFYTAYEYQFIELIRIEGAFEDGQLVVLKAHTSEYDCYVPEPFVSSGRDSFLYFVNKLSYGLSLRAELLDDTDEHFQEDMISYQLQDADGVDIEPIAFSINSKDNMVVIHNDKISYYKDYRPQITFEPTEKDTIVPISIVPDRHFYGLSEEVHVVLKLTLDSYKFTDYTVSLTDPSDTITYLQTDGTFAGSQYQFVELQEFSFTISAIGNWKITVTTRRRQDGDYISLVNESIVSIPKLVADRTFTLAQENDIVVFKNDNTVYVGNSTLLSYYDIALVYDYFIFNNDSLTLYTLYNYGALDALY